MHGGDGVAGVDGALEGVGAHNLGDVADLRDVELGGHAGRRSYRQRWRGRDVAVVAGDGQNLCSDVFSEAVGQACCVGVDDFGDTGDLGSGLAAAPALW